MKNFDEQFIVFKELAIAINSLKFISKQLSCVEDEPLNWMWIVIGLHCAIQNFMVLALQGSNPRRVLRGKHQKKWDKLHGGRQTCEGQQDEKKLKYSELEISSFLDLYSRIKDECLMTHYVGSKPFIPNETQDLHIEALNQYRNDFIHYFPKRTLILGYFTLLEVVSDCLPIIPFLAFKSQNIFGSSKSGEKAEETSKLIQEIETKLQKLRNNYENGFTPSQEGQKKTGPEICLNQVSFSNP